MSTPALLSAPLLVQLSRGRQALARLAPELERFAEALGVPLTSRAGWAWAAFAADSSLQPWTIVVRDRETSIQAAVVLAAREGNGGLEIVSPRPGTDDELRFAARSPSALDAIVDAFAVRLAGSPEPWTAQLAGLAPADRATSLLHERLPNALAIPGDDVPGLRLSGTDVSSDFRKDVRRSIRRSRARLAADAVQVSTHVEDRPEQIIAALSAIERAHRQRDHDAGRQSDLDDRAAMTFWQRAIEEHATRGAVEIALLRFNDDLAAYLVAFLDPPHYRVFDGRFVTRWARYTPGRLLEADVLSRIARDRRFAHVDWMTSVAPEKLIAHNTTRRSLTIIAGDPVRRGARWQWRAREERLPIQGLCGS